MLETHKALKYAEALDPQRSAPRIVCAANYHKRLLAIVIGVRHHDLLMNNSIQVRNIAFPNDIWRNDETIQGFVDQHGRFLTRTEAWVIAVKNGQIKRLVGNQTDMSFTETDVELNSENLY